MIIEATKYLDQDIMCSTCGKPFNPSKNSKILELLRIPALYANIWCSRSCMDKYHEFLEKNKFNK